MSSQSSPGYRFGPFELDVARQRLLRDGEPVPISPKTFDLLLLLVQQRDRLLEKQELMDRLWPGTFVDEANLTQQIFMLRKLLGEQPNGKPYIDTVPRRGYAFAADVQELGASSGRDNHVEEQHRGSAASHRLRRVAAWAIAAAAITGIAFILMQRPPKPAQTSVFSIDLPALAPQTEFAGHDFAISPDGRRVVMSLNRGPGRLLYLRSFDRPDLHLIPGTENATVPFFSPDGGWVGFGSGGKLRKVPLSGGSPITLCDAPRFRGASWGVDGTIVFAPRSSGEGLFKVSEDGGTPRRVTRLDEARRETSHRWPFFLPDGKHVLFSIDDWGGDYTRKKIAVVDLEGRTRRILVEGGTDPRFVAGHLIFARERTLYAQRFDPERLELSGRPVPVVENVITHAGIGAVNADISPDGTLVYMAYDADTEARELLWVDRRGQAQSLNTVRRAYRAPRLSPDGQGLVVGIGELRAADLWLLNLPRNSWSRIAHEGKSLFPIWSSDGRQIIFSSNRFGYYDLFSMPADGSAPATRLTKREHWPFARSVSPADRVVLAEEQHPVTSYDIWSVSVPTREVRPVLVTAANELEPHFSPDGKWFAYTSTDTGRPEVYVQSFPPGERRWAVSESGGRLPQWSRRGDELFFRTDTALMVSRVETKPALSIGKPQVLFSGEYALEYDVSPDAQRFVMMRESVRLRQSPRLTVVVGWFEELQRRVNAASRK